MKHLPDRGIKRRTEVHQLKKEPKDTKYDKIYEMNEEVNHGDASKSFTLVVKL